MFPKKSVPMSNLYVREYAVKCTGQDIELSSVPGGEMLVAKIKGPCPSVHEGFLVYVTYDEDGKEVVAGINLKSIYSFRTENIKDE